MSIYWHIQIEIWKSLAVWSHGLRCLSLTADQHHGKYYRSFLRWTQNDPGEALNLHKGTKGTINGKWVNVIDRFYFSILKIVSKDHLVFEI